MRYSIATDGKIKAEKSNLAAALKRKDCNNQLEIRAYSVQRCQLKVKLEQLRGHVIKTETFDDERVLQKKSHQKAKKEYEDSRIGRTWLNNLLKAKLEELLEDFGVSMGRYHGMEMEGPAVRRLLTRAGDICPRFRSLLVENCPQEKHEEITTVCSHFLNQWLENFILCASQIICKRR